VHLQLLGIGRNGHLAFNEPGHAVRQRLPRHHAGGDDARGRAGPLRCPRAAEQAVTSGLATILAARRLVLCAFGKAKAAAVRAMLHGPLDVACPASLLRRHGNVSVLLDAEAAGELAAASAR
jgi:glucosamine-6-phosphate deaminase